ISNFENLNPGGVPRISASLTPSTYMTYLLPSNVTDTVYHLFGANNVLETILPPGDTHCNWFLSKPFSPKRSIFCPFSPPQLHKRRILFGLSSVKNTLISHVYCGRSIGVKFSLDSSNQYSLYK